MSHRTLERVFVRMLYDPVFVNAVYTEATVALAGLDLSEAERENLVATDRRAWGHDPLRRLRTLRTLVDEFKASTTMLLSATGSIASLDAFFSSDAFHESVQHRGSLAGSFAGFLERTRVEQAGSVPLLRDVLRLEVMLARCRRALGVAAVSAQPATALPEGGLKPEWMVGLAPGHAVGRFDGNVVEAVNAVEKYLFEVGLMPAVALCDDAPRLSGVPAPAGESVYLLGLPSGAGVSLMPVDGEYGALLEGFSGGARRVREVFIEVKGIPAEDLRTMAESLIEEGVLEMVGMP